MVIKFHFAHRWKLIAVKSQETFFSYHLYTVQLTIQMTYVRSDGDYGSRKIIIGTRKEVLSRKMFSLVQERKLVPRDQAKGGFESGGEKVFPCVRSESFATFHPWVSCKTGVGLTNSDGCV